jgi:hypothetical protein
MAVWAVKSQQAFRIFRVLQRGPNANGQNYLMCAGIELWGVLFQK